MKIFQFILCFFLTTSTIQGITVYENSNLSKRSPTPYHSYIEFEDKREGGGYGYKFQIEGDHTEQKTHWQQPKFPQTNIEENSSYLPKYEQQQSYTHHVPIPVVKHQNGQIKQEYQEIENELQPQITFESNEGKIQHEPEDKVTFNKHPHGSEDNLQSYPNLFFPNQEHVNPTSNYAPIKLSQIPIITKYVPVPVKYMPMVVKEPIGPSRGHIKFASASSNAIPTKTQSFIIMKPNIGLASEATNTPMKYIMVPLQPSLDTNEKNMHNEHNIKEIQYQPNPEHTGHISYHQHQHHQQQQQQHQHMLKNIQNYANYEEEMNIKHNIPVKYVGNSNKEKENMYIPQKLFINPVQSNNQLTLKYNEEGLKKDIQKSYEQDYHEYLPNKLVQPLLGKKVVQYQIKTNAPEKNIPFLQGQPMYEYKTIQEEDYKKQEPSVDYQMLNMPELINKLPINTVDLQQKFMPQKIVMHPQQNFMLPNNIPQGINLGSMSNIEPTFGYNQQFQQLSSGFAHDLMPNVNFNIGAKRRSTANKNKLKSMDKKIILLKEQIQNN